MAEDPFEDLLSLEDQLYQEGYQLGLADGQQAGLAEGRAFGLEKGFEKYKAIGRLRGKSLVWASRLQTEQSDGLPVRAGQDVARRADDKSTSLHNERSLPALPSNSRLPKHIHSLLSATDPSDVSTANTEDSIEDFEERLKRAEVKAQIIEKIIGERSAVDGQDGRDNLGIGKDGDMNEEGKRGGEGDIEDLAALGTRG